MPLQEQRPSSPQPTATAQEHLHRHKPNVSKRPLPAAHASSPAAAYDRPEETPFTSRDAFFSARQLAERESKRVLRAPSVAPATTAAASPEMPAQRRRCHRRALTPSRNFGSRRTSSERSRNPWIEAIEGDVAQARGPSALDSGAGAARQPRRGCCCGTHKLAASLDLGAVPASACAAVLSMQTETAMA